MGRRMTESYCLMRSEPDVNTCRSSATWYYVDGKRAARDRYDFLRNTAARTDSLWTRQSSRGRWLHGCVVYCKNA